MPTLHFTKERYSPGAETWTVRAVPGAKVLGWVDVDWDGQWFLALNKET